MPHATPAVLPAALPTTATAVVSVRGVVCRWAAAVGLSLAGLLSPAPPALARDFQAEGSDTGAGVGPRYVAQGGAGQAGADDVYALYYNPAGLAALATPVELTLARQLNAEFHPWNFVGVAARVPLPAAWAWRLTAAAAYYPRVHGKAHGAYAEDDFESIFLRYLLPGMSGTFEGDIESKTKEYRLAFGLAPAESSPWAWGLYVDRIDCRSHFCGVTASGPGYTVYSSGAKAVGWGLGLRYALSPALTLGAQLSDVDTRLTVRTVVSDANGTRDLRSQVAFPRKLTTGLAWRPGGADTLALDYEVMKGRYGSSQIDLQVLRLGAERTQGDWAWRAGAVVPVRLYSSSAGAIRPPSPLSPTAGLGWRAGPLKLDAALYAHAVMSIAHHSAALAADVSLSLAF